MIPSFENGRYHNKRTAFLKKFFISYMTNFRLDGEETRRITPPEGGMWELGNFTGPNIYEDGTIMAPFDEEFYFILSTAPGVMWPWSDNCDPLHPWDPESEDPGRQLWEARETWLPTFQQPFMIDYIKVYQDEYQRSGK